MDLVSIIVSPFSGIMYKVHWSLQHILKTVFNISVGRGRWKGVRSYGHVEVLALLPVQLYCARVIMCHCYGATIDAFQHF